MKKEFASTARAFVPIFTRMICRALLLLAIACPYAMAQSGIESVPAAEPSAQAAPKKLPSQLTPTPAPEAPKRTPDEIVGAFFDALKADHVDAAYDTLKSESALTDRSDTEARTMRDQTQKALDAYGPVTGSDLVIEEKIGAHLMRRTYLLIGEVLPLRWKFYFYKSADRWKLIDLRIDDAIPTWFDENAKPAK